MKLANIFCKFACATSMKASFKASLINCLEEFGLLGYLPRGFKIGIKIELGVLLALGLGLY